MMPTKQEIDRGKFHHGQGMGIDKVGKRLGHEGGDNGF